MDLDAKKAMPQPFRTFIAVDVDEAVRREVGRLMGRLARTQAQVKWTAAEQLHLTLVFLGDVDGMLIPDICRRVGESVAGMPGFEIELAGVGAFPDRARPRTVWVGVQRGAEELCAMQRAIETALAELGFRPEARVFTPHLTLGRVRSIPRGDRTLPDLMRKDEAFACGATAVREAVVYSSVLGREGPTHEVLGRCPLA